MGTNWKTIYSKPKEKKESEIIDLSQILVSRTSHRGKHHGKINPIVRLVGK